MARAFSSSRRAPPMQQSKRNSSMAASSVGICRRLRLTSPGAGMAMPLAMASSTVRTMSLHAELRGAAVAELVQLGEVVPGVDVEQRHRDVGRAKGLLRQAQQADGVLAAGEQQRGPLEFRGDLAHHVDGLGFEILEVVEVIAVHWLIQDDVRLRLRLLRRGRTALRPPRPRRRAARTRASRRPWRVEVIPLVRQVVLRE